MNRELLQIAVFAAALASAGGVVVSCTAPISPEAPHFEIQGLHVGLSCTDCHGSSTLKGAPSTCGGCHESDRPADHYAGECGDCHTEDGWEFGVIDHERFLSLEGGHSELLCTDCHEEDDFTTLDAACVNCHADDEPANHYGTGCESCHNVYGWDDAEFDHPFFPTPHHGVSECADCHPGGDTNDFTCTDCHAHEKDDMDREHQGEVSNYVYDSDACLDCHPDGREDD